MQFDDRTYYREGAVKIKKAIAIVVIALLVFAFLACSREDSDVIIYPNGETKTGIPIIDHKKSKISKKDFNIIETNESEAFSEIGYCSEYELLFVRFRSSYEAYVYVGLDEYDWKQFRKAPSLGGWFNQNIKGQYYCYKW